MKANPVLFRPIEDPIFLTFILILIFLLAVGTEFIVFRLFLSKILVSRKYLSKAILKVNIVTFPLTQVFAYFLSLFFGFLFWVYITLIELIVIMIEWGLYQIEFKKLDIQRSPLKDSILKYTVVANICSYGIGLFIYLPLLLLY